MINDLNSIQESTGYWITRLARSMERDFEKRLEPMGLTRGGFAVLSAIHSNKKNKPAELAAFLGIDGAAVTRHLDRVEKQNLVERVPSKTDRRSTEIKLTEHGRQAVRRGRAASKATNEKFTAELSEAEIDRFQSVIRTMLTRSDHTALDL